MKAKGKKKLIAQVRRWIATHRTSALDELAANTRNIDRRGRVVKRFRTSLVNELFARSGVDAEKLTKLYAQDVSSMRRHLDEQEQGIRQRAKMARSELTSFIRRIRTSNRRFEYEGGNPLLTVCLWLADDIYFRPPLQTSGTTLTASALPLGTIGRNTAKVLMTASASSVWFPTIVLPVDFIFIWQSDRQGWLGAESWVSPIGVHRLEAPSNCWGDSEARVTLSASMSVAQLDPGGQPFPLGNSSRVTLLDKTAHGRASIGEGYIGGTYPRDAPWARETSISGPHRVPILAGQPVIAVVTAYLSVSTVADGRATLDCGSGSYELTVPSVWLTVET